MPAVLEVFVIKVHALPAVVCYSKPPAVILFWRERSVTEYTLHTKKGDFLVFGLYVFSFTLGRAACVREAGSLSCLSSYYLKPP